MCIIEYKLGRARMDQPRPHTSDADQCGMSIARCYVLADLTSKPSPSPPNSPLHIYLCDASRDEAARFALFAPPPAPARVIARARAAARAAR